MEKASLDNPADVYRFDAADLPIVSRLIGSGILYQLGKGRYYAAAKVESISRNPTNPSEYFAWIEPGSLVEFGQHVPLQVDGQMLERSLQYPNGRIDVARAAQRVRLIDDDDFFRVLDVVDPESTIASPPESDRSHFALREEQQAFPAAVDRLTEFMERPVRDRQFRRRITKIYNSKCAVSGSTLVDVHGNPEVQAAHIVSVKARGPDCLTNGMALSSSVHWTFDKGLISFTDDGIILLSSQINDPTFVKRHIPDDRKAMFPQIAMCRPAPQYLRWHRENEFKP